MTSTMNAQARLRPQPNRRRRTGATGVAIRSLVAVMVMAWSSQSRSVVPARVSLYWTKEIATRTTRRATAKVDA